MVSCFDSVDDVLAALRSHSAGARVSCLLLFRSEVSVVASNLERDKHVLNS